MGIEEQSEAIQFDCSVSQDEVDTLLAELNNNFHQEQHTKLKEACKRDVLNSIKSTFGIGGILTQLDKEGGNVTTLQNFEHGIVATKQDQERYEEWQNSQNSKRLKREPYDYDIQ